MTKLGIVRIVGECSLGGGCIGGGVCAHKASQGATAKVAEATKNLEQKHKKLEQDKQKVEKEKQDANDKAGQLKSKVSGISNELNSIYSYYTQIKNYVKCDQDSSRECANNKDWLESSIDTVKTKLQDALK